MKTAKRDVDLKRLEKTPVLMRDLLAIKQAIQDMLRDIKNPKDGDDDARTAA